MFVQTPYQLRRLWIRGGRLFCGPSYLSFTIQKYRQNTWKNNANINPQLLFLDEAKIVTSTTERSSRVALALSRQGNQPWGKVEVSY
jgi:hypothetical protein